MLPVCLAKQSPKPVAAARLNGWGGTGHPYGGRRFLTGVQLRVMRLQLFDLDVKLWQRKAALLRTRQ